MKALFAIAFSCCLIGLTGCGTLVTLGDEDSRPYAGVCFDANVISGGPAKGSPGLLANVDLRPAAVIDLPFSLIGDTLVLPLMVAFAIQKQIEEPAKSVAPPQASVPGPAH